MSKETRTMALLFLLLVVLVFGALILNGHPAEAHAQIYPHVHPHSHVSFSEDTLMLIAWLSVNVIALGATWFIGRKNRRSSK